MLFKRFAVTHRTKHAISQDDGSGEPLVEYGVNVPALCELFKDMKICTGKKTDVVHKRDLTSICRSALAVCKTSLLRMPSPSVPGRASGNGMGKCRWLLLRVVV